jgi:hypothetical protein
MEFTVPEGSTTLTVSFSDGVTIVTPSLQPDIGEPSHGIKLTGVNLRDRLLTVELDHVPATHSSFELRTPWTVRSVTGADFAASGPSVYQLTVKSAADAGSHEYERRQVSVKFADGAGS